MISKSGVTIYEASDLAALTSKREGETKVGEEINVLASMTAGGGFRQSLEAASQSGVRYAIIGVPEDIGPRANCGRGGSQGAWEAFLSFFLNTQSNGFFDFSQALLVGHIDTQELMDAAAQIDASTEAGISSLRDLCAELDSKVHSAVKEICAAGLVPIVVGGGHNNAYPIIKAVCEGKALDGIAAVNCDPHADFRRIEGRHSGNGFTYAHAEGLLQGYFVLGLQEAYNSRDLLARLGQAGFSYRTYDEIFVRGERSWNEAVSDAVHYLRTTGRQVGIELDLDSIANFPSSAESPFGITNEQAGQYIHQAASQLPVAYLHLPEGAPGLGHDGKRKVGKTVSQQVRNFLRAMGGKEG